VKLITHLQLVPRLRLNGNISPLLHAFSHYVGGQFHCLTYVVSIYVRSVYNLAFCLVNGNCKKWNRRPTSLWMLPEPKFSLKELNKRKQFLIYLCVLRDILTFILSIDLCKGKGLPQQAEVAQGVPGKLRPRIFLTFGTTRVVGR